MTETIQQITDVIRSNSSFLLTSHEGPDGDAVGSTLALASFLRKIGKDVTVHLRDPVPELYHFLPGSDSVSSRIPDRRFDAAFVLDIGEKRRAGDEFWVHRIASAYGYVFDRETALCLYVSIITDTGSFRYSNANREAFTVAGEMIECGVNAWDVAEQLYENQPRKRLELLGRCLPTLEVFKGGMAASVTVTLDMYAATDSNAELTDGFVNYPRSIRGVEVAIFFRQLEERKFKIGFRSKGKVNVAAFSAAMGGGGHHNAAGCTLDGTLEEVKATVYRVVEENL